MNKYTSCVQCGSEPELILKKWIKGIKSIQYSHYCMKCTRKAIGFNEPLLNKVFTVGSIKYSIHKLISKRMHEPKELIL